MGYLYTPCMYKLPQPMEFFPNEVFLDVALSELPEGFNHHKVSNYGRVYDYRREQFCNLHFDSKGYLYIIAAYNGEKKYPRVHRLVLATFGYIPGCETMLVNHLDGVKYHNYPWNLEWTDYSGNVKHAYATGLINNKQGEDRATAKITNAQAIEICELLQNGVPEYEVSRITGINRNTVYSIKNHKAWNSISKDYTFPERKPNMFTDDDIRNMCSIFESTPIKDGEQKVEYVRNVLSECNLSTDKSIIDNALNVYNKRAYNRISKDYDFG